MTEFKNDRKPVEKTQENASNLGLSRRIFLGTGMAAAAVIMLPKTAKGATGTKIASTNGITTKVTVPTSVPFVSPVFQEPQVTNNSTTFNLLEDTITVPNTEQGATAGSTYTITAHLYNGELPGPTFRVKPGESIDLTFNNNLPSNPEGDDATCEQLQHANIPACFNSTNMHFHGLHVSPKSKTTADGTVISSDDVLQNVSPGQTHQYYVVLPEKHAPGTHWYHSHRHGTTAVQVSTGMAGAIIIPEPTKRRKLGVTDDNDKIFLIQETLDVNDSANFYTKPAFSFGGGGKGGQSKTGQFLVNGQYQPTLVIDNPQTLQRWRFINSTGTPRGLMTLKLCKCTDENDTSATCGELEDMYLIAVDGISFYGNPPQKVGQDGVGPYQGGWVFAPGNRADFLLNLPAGKYKLLKDPDSTGPGVPSQVLAYIDVKEGTTAGGEIPDIIVGELPDYLQPVTDNEINYTVDNGSPGSLSNPRRITFAIKSPNDYPAGTPNDQKPKKFFVDGELYEAETVNHTVKLNTAEQWILSNPNLSGATPPGLGAKSPHPFHIHVNPFQLEGDWIVPLSQGGKQDPSNLRWWDTISVAPASSGDCSDPTTSCYNTDLTIRHRFLDYDGEYVLHCHILIHEDQGMMQNVVVEGNGVGPGEPLPLPCSNS